VIGAANIGMLKVELHQKLRANWYILLIAGPGARKLDCCDTDKYAGGKDQELLLVFARKILCWLPEERASASDIFEHEFLTSYSRN